MSLFEVKNLNFKYDKYDKNAPYVLKNISFSIEKNDFVALIGRSGSGKSTLINHLNGLIKADSGEILYNGKNIYDKDFDLTGLRFKCGVVFQHPEYQLFAETVIEDVMFGALKKGAAKNEAYEAALSTLNYLGIGNLKDEIPFNLSGGEKRKVAFAGVFVMDPDILIFDEPDAGLDIMSKNHFYNMLEDLNSKGKTIVIITHNLDDVIEHANKVILIDNGTVLKTGTAVDVLSNNDLMDKCELVKPYSIEIYDYLSANNIKIDKNNLKYDNLVKELYKVIL